MYAKWKPVTDQIASELRKEVDWIGVGKEKPKLGSSVKMFDYACGNGLASRVRSSPHSHRDFHSS